MSTEHAELLDPLEMLLDAARYVEGNGNNVVVTIAWAKAAREAVKQARLAPPQPAPEGPKEVTVADLAAKLVFWHPSPDDLAKELLAAFTIKPKVQP